MSKPLRRLAWTVSIALLCGGLAARFVFAAGLVGELEGLARIRQFRADSIRGTVLDVTGSLAAIQNDSSKTILMVEVPERQRDALTPGTSIDIAGRMLDGVLRAENVRVSGGSPWPRVEGVAESPDRIQHVLFLLQENHSFDNYFGTFPGVDGLRPNRTVEGVAPFHLSSFRTENLPHGRSAVLTAVNNGAMDKFVTAEHSSQTMGYYDGTDISNYWAYARRFSLADRFFASSTGPSLPNHLFALAASADDVFTNKMRPPTTGYPFPSLPETLEQARVSWKVYDGRVNPRSFSALDPFSGFSSFREDEALRSRLVPNVQLFRDLFSGGLPAAAWIFPNPEESEHPLTDIRTGMWYVTAVANALMKSPYWSSTVLVVSWDEYGGFYDHVPPPHVDDQGPGIRVPALIISSRAKPGSVDHTLYDFSSVLKFMERALDVPSLSARDAQANDIGANLDMSGPVRAPLLISSP